MSVACFVTTVDNVERLTADSFQVACTLKVMNEAQHAAGLSFVAVIGADWRVQCREAVRQYLAQELSETLGLLVLPNLETI